MNNLTEASQKLLLDWVLRGATPVRPAATWAGLAIGPPNSRYASELTNASYARQSVCFAPANSPAGTASNVSAMQWGPFGQWATILGIQIWDASTGGAMLWQAPLEPPLTLVPNDELNIADGGLSCGLS